MGNAKLKDDLENGDTFADELAAGAELMHGQYKIESFLNAGGFGITYSARDSLDRRVVIKECFPGAFCRRSTALVTARSRAHQNELASIVRLFVQEARSLAKLNHPNIVGVHQVFEENNTAYMALDFIEGRDLLAMIEENDAALPPEQLEDVLRKVLDAVGFVHDQGVLHRDISPDNILLNPDGEPVLIDFGAAREEASQKSRVLSALRVVKDGYSPQEFYITGSEQGPYSDLYALGATFYHLITRELPPNSQARLSAVASGETDPYVPLVGRFPAYKDSLLSSIDNAMAILPKDRIESAAAWIDLIDGKTPTKAVAAAASSAANKGSAAAPAEKKSSKGLLLASVAVIGLLGAGAFVATQTDMLAPAGDTAENTSGAAPVETPAAPAVSADTDLAAPAEQSDVAQETALADVPVIETPVVEAPVVEAPAVETPVVETPVVEDPAVETPVADAPVVAAPAAEAPVAEAPALEAPAPASGVEEAIASADIAPAPAAPAETEVIAETPAAEAAPASAEQPVVTPEVEVAPVVATAPVFVPVPAPAVTEEAWPVSGTWTGPAEVVVERPPLIITPAPSLTHEAWPVVGVWEPEIFVPTIPPSAVTDPAPYELELLPELPQPQGVATAVTGLGTVATSSDAPIVAALTSDGSDRSTQTLSVLNQPEGEGALFYDATVPPAPEPEVLPAPAPTPTAVPVVSQNVPGVEKEWLVLLPYADLFEVNAGEIRIFGVNGVAVNSLEEFNAAVQQTVPAITSNKVDLAVEMGLSADQTRTQNWSLPVAQVTRLSNGLSFETSLEGNTWITRVADVPDAFADRFRTGDAVFGYIPTSQVLETRDAMFEILAKGVEDGTTRYSFAVKRGDRTWVVNFDFAPDAN